MPPTDLNPAQREAVTTLSGPLLVLAGAGSGKTRVITYRIAELIRHGIKADRILAVTFTNKAAREMKERAMSLLGKRKKGGAAPEISTFHSLCVQILRRNITHLGYPAKFPIYDRSDQEAIARSALRDIRVSQDQLRPGDLLYFIGRWKTHSVRAADAEGHAQSDKEAVAALAYQKYQDKLKASGALDFDDLLLCTEELFSRFPQVRFAESGRFDHLLIDEYQDTNGLQYRIVKALADRHRNLCVVGDDDQSIYGWRGAEVEHILGFKNDWPDAKVVRLEANYRSREAILNLANTLIAHNSTRHQKVLRPYRKGGEPPRFVRFEDETTEAHAIVHEIRSRMDRPPPDRVPAGDFAILFRTNEQPRAFELELRKEKIPYVLVGGMSFYDRKEVRDLLAYLRVLSHPEDEVSLLRIVNTPARGIGNDTIKALLERAVKAGQPLWDALPDALAEGAVPAQVATRIADFRGLIEGYRARMGEQALVQITTDLLREIRYKGELERLYGANPSDVESRWASIEEIVNAIGAYENRNPKGSLHGFLEETALAGREDLKDDSKKEKRDAVTLMTLHSAKGLEFPHVYMVGMEEGLLPHQRSVLENRSVDEERRLAYVGVTRAQDTLTLSFCKNRMKWGKLRPSIPSRFIMEMRGETERAQRAAEASRKQLEEALAAQEAREEKAAKKGKAAKGKAGKGKAGNKSGKGKATRTGTAQPGEAAVAPVQRPRRPSKARPAPRPEPAPVAAPEAPAAAPEPAPALEPAAQLAREEAQRPAEPGPALEQDLELERGARATAGAGDADAVLG